MRGSDPALPESGGPRSAGTTLGRRL